MWYVLYTIHYFIYYITPILFLWFLIISAFLPFLSVCLHAIFLHTSAKDIQGYIISFIKEVKVKNEFNITHFALYRQQKQK